MKFNRKNKAKELNKISEIIGIISNRVESIAKKQKEEFPHITEKGQWQTTSNGYWTGGFWVGLLWLSYTLTRDKKFVRWAYKWIRLLEKRKNDRTFDVGFLFYLSFVLGYKITKDEYLRKTALEAADTLVSLFNESAGFVYNEVAINNERIGRANIDVMMNLPLLWWAYEETGDEKYRNVAYKHSISTIGNFIRDDYSTVHVIDFDLKTGEVIEKKSIQGYNSESCWARGQAWAIYGFALAYKTSKDKQFLKVAENLSDYFIKNLPDDFVPYWDFDDPGIPNAVKDSSAAAIACSGLLTLSDSEMSKERKFKDVALKMLESLSINYLSTSLEGVLEQGCFYKPKNIGVDESLIWGDYYFVESLIKFLEG